MNIIQREIRNKSKIITGACLALAEGHHTHRRIRIAHPVCTVKWTTNAILQV